MKYAFLIVVIALVLRVGGACAEEEGGHEHKAKPPDKPRPDSAISSVLQLPIVKGWQKWLLSEKHSALTAWGEEVKEMDGHKCWDIAVGVETADGVHVWRRFCVMQSGIEIFVESIPTDPLDEIHYITYDDWLKHCNPTYNSPGTC